MWKKREQMYVCEIVFILLKIHIEELSLKNAT